MTRIVFVIPAKCESKRAPGKNRLLFKRTLKAAYASTRATDWDNVIVSTDDERIAEVAAPGRVHERGPELAKSDVSATTVSIAALKHFNVEDDTTVVQLLLTSPFRASTDIDKALDLYNTRDPGYSAVLSVTPIHGKALCFEGSNGLLLPMLTLLPRGYRNGKWGQAHPLYLSNGAIQITSAKLLRSHGDFWKIPKKLAYVMDEYSGFDVDSQAQLEMAEGLMEDTDV